MIEIFFKNLVASINKIHKNIIYNLILQIYLNVFIYILLSLKEQLFDFENNRLTKIFVLITLFLFLSISYYLSQYFSYIIHSIIFAIKEEESNFLLHDESQRVKSLCIPFSLNRLHRQKSKRKKYI